MRSPSLIACVLCIALGAAPSPAAQSPADAAFAAGDFTAARAAYDAQLKTTPADPHALLRAGELALFDNDLDAAEPLLRAIPASAPEAQTATRQLAEIARRRTENAKSTTIDGGVTSVPLLAVDPLPVVRVNVDGTEADFLIDTGAPDIVLDPSLAQVLHLDVVAAGTGVFAGGRTAAISHTVVPVVRIGGATARDVSATVLPTAAAQFFPHLHIDGIVGTGFFERFLATIDYPRAQLTLRSRDRSTSLAFERTATTHGATIVPCWLVADHFVFAQAQVGDAPAGLFLFDSGLAGGGVMPSAALVAAAHLALDTAHTGTGQGGGGPVQVVPFVAPTVAVGDASQRNVPGSYTPQGTPFGIFPFAVEGAVSHLFLKHYAYTVDFTAMKIVLQP